MTHPTQDSEFSAVDIATALNRPAPTAEQRHVIEAPLEPQLVVAGAGAGKTETMAARAVWLVANGYVSTDQILGLTFTRKAVGELNARIRTRLTQLSHTDLIQSLPPGDRRRTDMQEIQQTVVTYDSFMQKILNEFGLLVPIEPAARVADMAEQWLIASRVIDNMGYKDERLEYEFSGAKSTARTSMLGLSEAMTSHVVTPDHVREESQALIDNVTAMEGATHKSGVLKSDPQAFCQSQIDRLMLLRYQEEFNERLSDRLLMTYGQITAAATKLVKEHPEVGREIRTRYRAVFLDEYQDTNHAQHSFLHHLFGIHGGHSGSEAPVGVTAVGDPMQSIYGFRGATPGNLYQFIDDFPRREGDTCVPCSKKELSESFRNPNEVLELANTVARNALSHQGQQTSDGVTSRDFVTELTSGRPDCSGEVSVTWALDEASEVEWVVDSMEDEYRAALRQRDIVGRKASPFTGAILVRKNNQVQPFADALRKRGIPFSISTDELVDIPEVREVLSVLRVVVNPADDDATLQVLSSPRWRIGTRDIKALNLRAKQLKPGAFDRNQNQQEPQEHLAPIDVFAQRADGLELPGDGTEVSLADAIADLGVGVDSTTASPSLSDEGRRRVEALSAELRWLRQQSTVVPLPDLIASIESTLHIRAEVLARQDPSDDGAAGTIHLDRLRDVAEDFTTRGGSTHEFLAYLAAATDSPGRGLEAGEVAVHADQVQILTVHSAKGLEWDVVAVPFCDEGTYVGEPTRPSAKSWLTVSHTLPSGLRGDPQTPTNPLGFPVFEDDELTDWTEFDAAHKEYKKELRAVDRREADFLFYVAITRSARRLLVSGHSQKQGTSRSLAKFQRFLDVQIIVADKLGINIDENMDTLKSTESDGPVRLTVSSGGDHPTWTIDLTEPSADEAVADTCEEDQLMWPQDPLGDRRQSVDRAAELVRAAMTDLVEEGAHDADRYAPHADPGTLAATWENETTALIEEARAAHASHVDVPLGMELTTSEIISAADDVEAFARRRARPVPFKPNPYAKRGTAFHNWLETELGGSSTLIDDDELWDPRDEDHDVDMSQPELDRLKDAFMQSEWAGQAAWDVERPFVLNLGGYYIRGRMDAVFKRDTNDGGTEWIVVDWKTGSKPIGRAMARAEIQLAVYKEALRRDLAKIGAENDIIRAAFHYVRLNETYEPDHLATPDDIIRDVLSTLDNSE